MEALDLSSVDYSPRVVDEAALAAATSEEPFAREAFECLKEVAQSVVVTASIVLVDEDGQPRSLTRDEAIISGLMVRCMKLQFGLLSAASEQKMELLNLSVRSVVETAVNLRYLLEFGDPDVFERFVRYSLRTDKKLYEQINAEIAARGHEIPFERRILDGIEKAFEAAGIELDAVDAAARWSWSRGGIWGRFDELGIRDLYVPLFGTQSHYLHGNWHDLWAYHLESTGDGFTVDTSFGPIRPQPLFLSTLVLGDASIRYLQKVVPHSSDRDALENRLALCTEKIRSHLRPLRDVPRAQTLSGPREVAALGMCGSLELIDQRRTRMSCTDSGLPLPAL